jgi:MtN3 and saliva related transmembrane protein
MKDHTVYIGIVAGICTAISMLPQLIKIIKEKKAEDISLIMLLILLTGVGGWAWYGVMKEDYPIIVTNSFSFLLNLLIIFFSRKYKKKENPSKQT